MAYTRSIFSQLLQWIPRLEFQKAVNAHQGDYRVRKLRTWSQFVALLFGQLSGHHSLRPIEAGMRSARQKPFSTDMTLTATRTRDKSIDVAGRSHQRQYGVSTQTKVNDEERLDVDYNLNLTDNYAASSDLRTMNWKCAYVVQKFIQDDGNFTLSYSSNKTEEEVTTQNYREAVWRADANLKWGGPAPDVTAKRDEAEGAVKEILAVYAEEDILKFMQLVSKTFKADRIAFENQVRALYDRVDAIKYEGVWASSFVPGDNVLEITFRWQRRWRVYATGAEETATGVAVFRLEKSADKWLLQEVRETSPFFLPADPSNGGQELHLFNLTY